MGIDAKPENTPPEVRDKAARTAAMFSSNEDESLPPEDDLTEEEKKQVQPGWPSDIDKQTHQPAPVTDPLEAFSNLLQHRGDRKEVKISTPIGVIVLKALHVSVNTHGVGVIINKDDIHLDPELGTELHLVIDDRPVKVIYAGGLFTFNKIPVTFLSFLRVDEEKNKPAKDHGEERES